MNYFENACRAIETKKIMFHTHGGRKYIVLIIIRNLKSRPRKIDWEWDGFKRNYHILCGWSTKYYYTYSPSVHGLIITTIRQHRIRVSVFLTNSKRAFLTFLSIIPPNSLPMFTDVNVELILCIILQQSRRGSIPAKRMMMIIIIIHIIIIIICKKHSSSVN